VKSCQPEALGPYAPSVQSIKEHFFTKYRGKGGEHEDNEELGGEAAHGLRAAAGRGAGSGASREGAAWHGRSQRG